MTKKRVDSNHTEIKNALIAVGFECFDASAVGRGFPDLVVSKLGQTFLVEIKTEKGKLTKSQVEFFKNWQGTILVVYSVEDAITQCQNFILERTKSHG